MSRKRKNNRNSKAARKIETAKLSAQLAPLEEQQAAQKNGSNDGVIVVDADSLHLESDLIERENGGIRQSLFHLEPVVIAILVFSVIFIIFVIWQISLMPLKDAS